MIDRLSGTLATCEPGRATVDVGGVGYEVWIPLSTYYEIVGLRDDRVTLFVHTHVREDALQLFGFRTEIEREAFRRFIGISGVGPKLALAVLSGIDVGEMAQAVRSRDSRRLQRIPGVGRKTAERLIVELQDRFPVSDGATAAAANAAAAGADGVGDDAASALSNLGYSDKAARKAVEAVREGCGGDEATLQDLIRAALAHLVR